MRSENSIWNLFGKFTESVSLELMKKTHKLKKLTMRLKCMLKLIHQDHSSLVEFQRNWMQFMRLGYLVFTRMRLMRFSGFEFSHLYRLKTVSLVILHFEKYYIHLFGPKWERWKLARRKVACNNMSAFRWLLQTPHCKLYIDSIRRVLRQAAGQAAQVHFTEMNTKSGLNRLATDTFWIFFHNFSKEDGAKTLTKSGRLTPSFFFFSFVINNFDSVFDNLSIMSLGNVSEAYKLYCLLRTLSSVHCSACNWNDLCTEYVNEVNLNEN